MLRRFSAEVEMPMVRSSLPPEGVEPVFGHGEELAVAAAELRTAFDRVVTKGVMLPQELFDTLVPGLLARDCNAV